MDKPSNANDRHSQQSNSMLAGGNMAYLEQLYEDFLRDANSVTPAWRTYFQIIQGGSQHDIPHSDIHSQALLKALPLYRKLSALRSRLLLTCMVSLCLG